MIRHFATMLLALLAGCSGGQRTARAADPLTTDPDKYRLILENSSVRVLRYHDEPGARTRLHHHPDFVMYALAPFRRRLTLGNGTVITRDFQAGDAVSMPAQDHQGENIGSTPTEALLVEQKGPGN